MFFLKPFYRKDWKKREALSSEKGMPAWVDQYTVSCQSKNMNYEYTLDLLFDVNFFTFLEKRLKKERTF